MITLKNLITHALISIHSKELVESPGNKEPKVYGHIDLLMGPGDEFGFINILIKYDKEQKLQYVTLDTFGSPISKSLFDRDIAPKCYEFLSRIKTELGKLEYDTIHFVSSLSSYETLLKPY